MEVTYVDHMGTDLSVVNAARVSFSKKSKGYEITDHTLGTKKLSDADTSLIQFLARGCTSGDWNDVLEEVAVGDWKDGEEFQEIALTLKYIKNMPTHWTPFGHTAITLHIKAPIFVARQLGKHQTGLVWNEVSRRYVSDEPEFYVPDVWRKKADNVKQGSSDEEATHITWDPSYGEDGGEANKVIQAYNRACTSLYNAMLNCQIAPEQARMVLPQSMYTEWYWTGNLYSFANVYIQRSDSHAQKETQEIAKQIDEVISPLFPVSWEALTK